MATNTSTPPAHINILTLNCWGLKYLAAHRRARLSHIGHLLSQLTPTPHIIGLQEVWTQEDYQSIRSQTSQILPYGKFFYSGVLGAGLAILSRWPIVESAMHAYPLNGRPTAFFRGDWYVGKGVACARIEIPAPGSSSPSNQSMSGSPPTAAGAAARERPSSASTGPEIIEVFTTHLHAPYEREPNDSYLCHRTAQAHYISKLIRDARDRGHLAIACGDFNMLPDSLAHRLITAHGGATDVWTAAGRPASFIAARRESETQTREQAKRNGVSVRWKLETEGATCDSMGNTWRWPEARRKALQRRVKRGREIPETEREIGWDEEDWPDAKRLDYIFVAQPPDAGWAVESAKVGMTERHPTLHCSLSDHFSVEATLVRRLRPLSPQESLPPGASAEPPLPHSTYRSISALTNTYILRERFQRRARIGHFFLSVAVTIGCWIAVWWSPRNFVSFLLMLLASLGLMAGAVDGLIGFLFVGSEMACLREFLWEVQRWEERSKEGDDDNG